jgi:hypothetical protein
MVESSPRHPFSESSPGGPATPSSPEAKKIEWPWSPSFRYLRKRLAGEQGIFSQIL